MPDCYHRRDLLRHIGATVSLAVIGDAGLPAQDARQIHAVVRDEALPSGEYQPRALTAHEFESLTSLADRIIPADEHSGGAREARAAEFIDFLCSASDEIKNLFTGGLAWLDHEMRRRYGGADFLGGMQEQQTAMLDLIAWSQNQAPELNPGIAFFARARGLVVDAYYTSPMGIKDLGYMGNRAMRQFAVPKDAVEFALKRIP